MFCLLAASLTAFSCRCIRTASGLVLLRVFFCEPILLDQQSVRAVLRPGRQHEKYKDAVWMMSSFLLQQRAGLVLDWCSTSTPSGNKCCQTFCERMIAVVNGTSQIHRELMSWVCVCVLLIGTLVHVSVSRRIKIYPCNTYIALVCCFSGFPKAFWGSWNMEKIFRLPAQVIWLQPQYSFWMTINVVMG